MTGDVVRAAQWIVGGMVGCTVLLLAGGYWIVSQQPRPQPFPDLVLPPMSNVRTQAEPSDNELRMVADEWNRLWTNDPNGQRSTTSR